MIVLPLSRDSLTPVPCPFPSMISSRLTLSLSLSVARFSRRWWHSVSAISASTKGSSRSRLSISVTRTPRAAKMLAYSQPITPAPTTANVLVKRNMRIASRFRPDGNDNVARGDGARRPPVDMIKTNGIGSNKGSFRGDELDIVAPQLMAHDVDFMLDHPVGADQEILDRNMLLDGVGDAVEFA